MSAAQQMAALSREEAAAIDQAMQTGLALHGRGQLGEAERLYAGVLKLAAHHFDALHLLGVLRHQQGDCAEALRLLAEALKLNARSPDALNHHAKVLLQVGRSDEALASLDKALTIDPDHVPALIIRAAIRIRRGEFPAALADADRALERDPDNAEAWSKRGAALAGTGQREKAIGCYGRALAIEPSLAEALNNRAGLLSETGHSDKALADLDRVVAGNPSLVEAWLNRGHALMELGRDREAIASYQQAFAISQLPVARFMEGLAHLRLGDFARGWEYYECRWHAPAFVQAQRHYPCRRWTGEQLPGRLLVSGEQGLGEQILFASMLPDVSRLAQSVTVEVEPRLIPLYVRSFPTIKFVPLAKELHAGAADAHIAMGSLGQYLRRDAGAFAPRKDGFLRSDAKRAAQLRERLNDGRRVVGLAWNSRNPIYQATKSIGLPDFAALLQLPGCRFIDLQYGDTAAERRRIEGTLGVRIEHLDDVDNTNDLDGLAALICACDLVVTVSNTTAHLAGALGRETHILVPSGRGRIWHWFNDRDDSPWYPRVRLWRQRPLQPWTDVIGNLTAAHRPTPQ